MAKKKAVVQDNKSIMIDVLLEFLKDKNIDNATLTSVLEDVFRNMIRKKYASDKNYNVIVNVNKGDIQIFRDRVVVEDGEVEDESTQIPLSEALKIDEDFTTGDEVSEAVDIMQFGRRLILSAKQLLAQRIKDLEKSNVYETYKAQLNQIIIGEVYQVWKNEILVMHNGNELILPKEHQIPKDKFNKGDTIKALIVEVKMKNSSPYIVISRTSPIFLERLMEQEVPEILDGLITVKSIVREPGERAKVAVESYDDRIDPVGSCVGMKGSRIHGIVKELRNENIDVINYSHNPQIFVERALTPAKASYSIIDEENHQISVYFKPDQISLAIGKGGINIKLASKLTGYTIDVFREPDPNEEDVDLDEFKDEIEEWIIDTFKEVGLDTAKSVLNLSVEEIHRRTELDKNLIRNVLEILEAEFEDDDDNLLDEDDV
ncbi:MAG: transcription termination/antitermination protein NusA [Bacteroidia bacterium]|nr:MAG: transcription termination/antitermination protein NusA [Bacteroidia bacterium]